MHLKMLEIWHDVVQVPGGICQSSLLLHPNRPLPSRLLHEISPKPTSRGAKQAGSPTSFTRLSGKPAGGGGSVEAGNETNA
jgi:hypothetical protein